MSTLRRLKIDLHQKEKMPFDIAESNIECALAEIERDKDAVPID
jgi:hypothetical protein